jgi:hypothetical protein
MQSFLKVMALLSRLFESFGGQCKRLSQIIESHFHAGLHLKKCGTHTSMWFSSSRVCPEASLTMTSSIQSDNSPISFDKNLAAAELSQ